MIELQKVKICVGERCLLSEVSLIVNSGDKAILSGASGCGKSTLLQAVAGLQPIDAGRILINQMPLNTKHLKKIRQQIAYITQDAIMGAEIVRDSLLLPFSFSRNKELMPSEDKICEILDKLQLTSDILNKDCRELSGGERQRICVGRALLTNRPIIIADEMTSALDEKSRDLLVNILLSLDATVLAVSHDATVVDAFQRKFKLEAEGVIEE